MEKFAVKKSEQFFAQGNKLVLPAIELIYLWNGFKVLGKQKNLVNPILSLIEKTNMTLPHELGMAEQLASRICMLVVRETIRCFLLHWVKPNGCRETHEIRHRTCIHCIHKVILKSHGKVYALFVTL
jgi:hypothetical protein